ncbi:hypothetical protein PO909_025396 [Leuciscus waleckii]
MPPSLRSPFSPLALPEVPPCCVDPLGAFQSSAPPWLNPPLAAPRTAFPARSGSILVHCHSGSASDFRVSSCASTPLAPPGSSFPYGCTIVLIPTISALVCQAHASTSVTLACSSSVVLQAFAVTLALRLHL